MDYVQQSDVFLYKEFDNRYARFERRFGVERQAVSSVPTIDVSAFTRESTEAERRATAEIIRKTCINIGFFSIVGHGIPEDELDRVLEFGRAFFNLPVEKKMTVLAGKVPGNRGWVRTGGVDPANSPERTPDIKERFFMDREPMPDEIGGPRTNQWPSEDILPDFAPFMKAHVLKRIKLARQMARAFALSLGLPETWFDDKFSRIGTTLALNYYPPVDPSQLESNQWSFSPHTDYGTFTLLTQDNLGGLQARNIAGDWIDIDPVPGAFIVNIGDTMARWTNDLYSSNLHRAMNIAGDARISAAFFTAPNYDTLIECLPTCQGPDNPPRHEPVRAGEYSAALARQSHLTGRPGISTETAKKLRA